jgi:3-hydroxybutyryl-CoA dehydrogenase
MKHETVAVVGAGVMGSDLALDLAINGYNVILKDLTDDHLVQARDRMRKTYSLVRMMRKGKLNQSLGELLDHIQCVTDYEAFSVASMVIENITENYEAKKTVYQELDGLCSDNVLYGIDTSCISITRLAALMSHPENVIGMHFMNPVPLKPLVEVIRGHHTSEETLTRTKAFLSQLHKTVVVVNDMPGFVTNRVLMPMINECIWLVADQVAHAKDVDRIFKMGFGHKMGPLATADLIGLDTILDSLLVLYESYNDSKYRPCPLLRKMVDAGQLGVKSRQGFFEYGH